ncbi:hypothetical protein BT69DRAFT_911304 [Atractiella rhizophila]|nr:hypothetical protein BT69DRAFT_911304 [Atractiella rhizophila]
MLSAEKRKGSVGAKTWTFKDSPLYRERHGTGTPDSESSASNSTVGWRISAPPTPTERPKQVVKPASEPSKPTKLKSEKDPSSPSSGSSFWGSFFGSSTSPKSSTSSSPTPSSKSKASTSISGTASAKEEKDKSKKAPNGTLSSRLAATSAAAAAASTPTLAKGKTPPHSGGRCEEYDYYTCESSCRGSSFENNSISGRTSCKTDLWRGRLFRREASDNNYSINNRTSFVNSDFGYKETRS